MPTITGQPAVDVAIGLFFAFFLLSVLCSAINEAIATAFAWRSKTLLAALRSMLADDGAMPERARQSGDQATAPAAGTPAEPPKGDQGADDDAADTQGTILTQVLDHPLIRSQVNETDRRGVRRTVPSYLPSRTFALALLDTLTDEPDASDSAFVQAEKAIGNVDNPQVRGALTTLLADARGNVARFRDGVEGWFDATMARATGWYKRRTQLSLWVIAAVVTVAFNADAAQIASSLWKDPALRASVVAQAQKAVDDGDQSDLEKAKPNGSGGETLTTKIDSVRELGLPLGWSTDKSDPRWPDDTVGWLAKIAGLLATVVALSLGAPFWFDLLGKVSRLKGTGTPPPKAG
jgi:hypothetical protein